jgi:hypothetical protein
VIRYLDDFHDFSLADKRHLSEIKYYHPVQPVVGRSNDPAGSPCSKGRTFNLTLQDYK